MLSPHNNSLSENCIPECAICLESIERLILPIVCERGHPLHPICFRELVNSRTHLNERSRCPSCRGVFLCMMCENGARSRVLCIFCATERLLRHHPQNETPLERRNPTIVTTTNENRDALFRFNKVFETIQQHAIIFAIWFGLSHFLSGCLKLNQRYICDDHNPISYHTKFYEIWCKEDIIKLFFEFSCFINLHLNVWVCCDRFFEILISDSDLRGEQVRAVHQTVRRLLFGTVVAQIICFVYEAFCICFDSY